MGGRDKLMEDVSGQPLLRDRALMCLASKADAVRVVLSPNHPARRAALDGLNVETVETADPALGLSHSLQTGAAELSGDLMVVLADLPDLTAADLDHVMAESARSHSAIVRGATEDGASGHPVLIKSHATHLIAGLSGDAGLKFGHTGPHETALVKIDAQRARTDLDTPADWARWRAGRSTS